VSAHRRPLRIGLVGPIGCGKSTVARLLHDRGAVVIDGDALAREVTAPGEPTLEAIAERFGADLIGPDGVLDRAALGRRVFGDPAALRALEAITHPAIRPRLLTAVQAADKTSAPVVVVEAIRLVDGGYVDLVDEVWLVTCDPATQRRRLARRGLDDAEAARRTASQAGLVDRATAVADRVLDTSGPLDATLAAVDAALTLALEERRARG
jgi:dephospho-CoA kinase